MSNNIGSHESPHVAMSGAFLQSVRYVCSKSLGGRAILRKATRFKTVDPAKAPLEMMSQQSAAEACQRRQGSKSLPRKQSPPHTHTPSKCCCATEI